MPSYSAINVPTDTAGFVELINATNGQYYYISPEGNDTSGDGSNGNPWKSLNQAWNSIENKRIAKDSHVYFVIKSIDGATGWDQKLVSDSTVTIRHPDADKITIMGDTSSNLTLYGINYYDSTERAMGDAVTGGYLMELTVADASTVEVGDFISIKDENYSTSSFWGSGVSGPTFFESDFAHYNSGQTSGWDVSGITYSAPPLSVRKFLATGCHEVVGVDYNAGADVNSQNILVHIRHHNPTKNLHTVHGGAGSSLTGATSGYISPQGLLFNGGVSLWPSGINNPDTSAGTAGYIAGTDYSGITAHRLIGRKPTAGNLPLSSGHTSGATGNFGGWTAGWATVGYDGGFVQVGALHGSTFGGVSGGNARFWDKSPTNSGHSGAFNGITVKVLHSRINFQDSSGLNIVGTKLAKIQDLVICGPGFKESSTTNLQTDTTMIGVKSNDGGGLLETSNVAVLGFETGFKAEDNGFIDASGSIAGNCGKGFASENNGYIRAKSTFVSGCSMGYYASKESHIEASHSVAAGNFNCGFQAVDDSSINAPFSVSCLNGGEGYCAERSSHLQLHLAGRETTLHGSTNDTFRYGNSDKTGVFAFRNSGSGIKADSSSSVYAPHARTSYNVRSGYEIDKQSSLNAPYSNSWFNGQVHGADIAGISSGFQISTDSTAVVNKANSYWNGKNGFEASVGSLIKNEGGTADRNQHNAFHAEYLSTIKANSTTRGITNSGFSGGAPGQGVAAHVGVGFNSASDSTIFIGTNSSGTSQENSGVVRTY